MFQRKAKQNGYIKHPISVTPSSSTCIIRALYTSRAPTKTYRIFSPSLKYSINSTRSEGASLTKYVR